MFHRTSDSPPTSKPRPNLVQYLIAAIIALGLVAMVTIIVYFSIPTKDRVELTGGTVTDFVTVPTNVTNTVPSEATTEWTKPY